MLSAAVVIGALRVITVMSHKASDKLKIQVEELIYYLYYMSSYKISVLGSKQYCFLSRWKKQDPNVCFRGSLTKY